MKLPRPFNKFSYEVHDGGNFHRFGFNHTELENSVDLNRPMLEVNIKKTLRNKSFITLAAASTLLCCGGGGALLYFATH